MRTKLQYALARARYLLKRLDGQPVNLDEARFDIEELYPPSIHAGKAGLHLPEHLDRLSHVAFGRDLKLEIEQFLGGEKEIPPTLRFEFRNVVSDGRAIYDMAGCRKLLSLEGPTLKVLQRASAFKRVSLRSSFLGCHYFGHWLRDDCATHMLAEWEESDEVISAICPDWIDIDPYMRAFNQQVACPELWSAKSLVCFDDVYQNEHKASRLLKLRDLLRASYHDNIAKEIVYLKRGPNSGKRDFTNEQEIVDLFWKMGIHVLDCENDRLDDQLPLISGAKLFIGVEGSQLSHALYNLSSKGGLLVIQPPDRFFNSHMDWAWVTENAYGVVIGESVGELSFRLEAKEILEMIDIMFAAMA